MATKCYVCGSERNEIALRESPMQIRFGKRVLPDDEYRQRICLDCGLLFVDYSVTDEYLNDMYSSESVDWQKQFTGSAMTEGEERVGEFRSLRDLIFRIKPATNGARLLDFGCQTGEFGEVVSQNGMVEPFGVDLSRDYADHAMKKWQRGFVHVGALATSPFSPGTFDYISAQETLEHLVDPLRVLLKLRELIKDDGIILITVPSTHYFMLKKRIFSLLGKRRALVHTHIYNFTPKSVALLLEKARFKPMRFGGTGWHGPIRGIANPVARALFGLTGSRSVYYPSLVCIAKPASELAS
jgi:2-polyprenyl-3-methyl-5-hydroxy-6-metoxy-1,4-benzoquinol methylase